MNKVRLGIIGFGGMGSGHANYIMQNKIEGLELAAVCDIDENALKRCADKYGDKIKLFDDAEKLFAAKCVDAVIISTPHYFHPTLAIRAFKNGIHVLSEKPAGVYTKQVREMNEAAEKSGLIFGIMFNERTRPEFITLKNFLETGELGEIKRTNWIITNWYRPQAYYDSGTWRATWSGEGGGVLMNQAPHNLDLWQWTCGMPKSVRGFCQYGRYHDIEVEDDVTAYVKYENGATGVFITTTGEYPGGDRLEIAGDRGKVVVEDKKVKVWKLGMSEREFNKNNKIAWPNMHADYEELPVIGTYPAHEEVTRRFTNAILKGEKLIAKGTEGINGLQICNAIYLSSWLDRWVDIPVDEDLYLSELEKKKAGSIKK